MAVTWSTRLPAPLRSGLNIKPTPDVRGITMQSGRKDLRRFGAGSPDVMTCTLRCMRSHPVKGDQVEEFNRFWAEDLNFGQNWIDASWLASALGYINCYCRIIGYSKRKASDNRYCDYALTVLIQKTTNCWGDTSWPSAGPGSGRGGEC